MGRLKLITMIGIILLILSCKTEPSKVPKPATESFGGKTAGEWKAILNYSDDDRDNERRLAAVALAGFSDPDITGLLSSRLSNDLDPKVRKYCAIALGNRGDSIAAQALAKALYDSDREVVIEAVQALGKLPGPKAISYLREFSMTSQGEMLISAISALASRGEQIPAVDQQRLWPVTDGSINQNGETWYVDASDGNDANPGTIEAPMLSLQIAVNKMRSGKGDRIFATSGKNGKAFNGPLNIQENASGNLQMAAAVSAWPAKPSPVVIATKNNNPVIREDYGIKVLGAHHFIISGFHVYGSKDSGIALIYCRDIAVIQCKISDCDRHGIFAYYSPASILKDCSVTKCNFQGISIRSSPNTSVIHCNSSNNGIDGILFLYGSDHSQVVSSITQKNRHGISFMHGTVDGKIIDCIVAENADKNIFIDQLSSAVELDIK